MQLVQILTHGSSLDNYDAAFQYAALYQGDNKSYAPMAPILAKKTQNDEQEKQQKGRMIFKFMDNNTHSVRCIKSSDLFSKILDEKNKVNQDVPLFVISAACHGGLARNDIEFLGKMLHY